MQILGIETSCDETAAAVVEDGTNVLSNVISSQIKIHQKTQGVVPEVAARQHILKIIPVIDKALKNAKTSLQKIDAIAVTQNPGLISSLLVGTNTASTLALLTKKPLIPIHHIEGHIYANFLDRVLKDIRFPILILTVSGGHNDLILMKNHNKFELLGETIDDAAGEAFDKVAKILGLPYPGGPEISKIALKGDPNKYDLPRPMLNSKNMDFSFSGLKTAVLYLTKKQKKLTQKVKADIAASFQEAVCDVLTAKLLKASQKFNPKEIHLAGGVSANQRLREMVAEKISQLPDPRPILRHPNKMIYCTDNAAMVAGAAYFKYQQSPSKFKQWKNVIANCDYRLL